MTAGDEGRAAARRAEMERQVRASGACEAFQGAMGQEHCQRCGRNEHLHWLRELLFWGGRSPSRTRQNAEALLGRVGGVITLSTADDVTRFCEAIVREALALSGQQPCAECDRLSRAVEALIKRLREYQVTSQSEARKAARQGDVAEQRARQAEASTLNVCIIELEALASPAPAADKEQS
jgi:hypothetical protein